MNKKKVIIIVTAAVIAVAAICAAVYILMSGGESSTEETVYVESVASMMGVDQSGVQNVYAGVVETQEEWNITSEADKEIKEILVEEGQEVEEGTELFTYEMKEVKDQLSKAELDVERSDSSIADLRSDMNDLEKQKKNADADTKRVLENEIQTKKAEVRQAEYEKEALLLEMQQFRETIENSTVKSRMHGVVKAINSEGVYDEYSDNNAFMTIISTGDYRVKGKVNEQNVWSLEEGMPVIVRSRTDKQMIWNGTLEEITEEEVSDNSGDYYGEGGDDSLSSTTYPFYVSLDSTEGLMLGQHIYIELDYGQEEERAGIWLDEFYIVQEDDAAYVWAADGKERLEKRIIELGEYDEDMMQYAVTSGLSLDDYITYPDEHLREGMKTIQSEEMNEEESMNEGDSEEEIFPEAGDE